MPRPPDLTRFRSCPLASRHIDTPEDAASYYAHRLVGDRIVRFAEGRELAIRFNAEEIHLYTTAKLPPGREPPQVTRPGRTGEVRWFDVERARLLDHVLATIGAPAVAVPAKMPGGILLLGPPDLDLRQRIGVVVGPDTRSLGVWFVRSSYVVSPRDFTAYTRAKHRPPWPP